MFPVQHSTIHLLICNLEHAQHCCIFIIQSMSCAAGKHGTRGMFMGSHERQGGGAQSRRAWRGWERRQRASCPLLLGQEHELRAVRPASGQSGQGLGRGQHSCCPPCPGGQAPLARWGMAQLHRARTIHLAASDRPHAQMQAMMSMIRYHIALLARVSRSSQEQWRQVQLRSGHISGLCNLAEDAIPFKHRTTQHSCHGQCSTI